MGADENAEGVGESNKWTLFRRAMRDRAIGATTLLKAMHRKWRFAGETQCRAREIMTDRNSGSKTAEPVQRKAKDTTATGTCWKDRST